MFKYLSLILSAFCLTITTFNQEAYALNARASASWSLNSTDSNDDDGLGTGTYTLGNQNINCGGTTRSKAQIEESYTSSTDKTLSLSRSCSDTQVNASSNMKVTGGTRYFDWELDLTATVNRQSGSPSGSAVARGADPQFFNEQTFVDQIFREEVTLAAETSIFASNSEDIARTEFSRGSSVQQDPFWSIQLLASGPSSKIIPFEGGIDGVKTISSVDATVEFHQDLKFFIEDSDGIREITASDLEDILEDEDNGLGTNNGLRHDISFSYEWDYSEFDLTSDPTLYGGGESFAQSGTLVTTPEPTSIIDLIALGTIGAVTTLKRKLQSSKEKS